MVRAAATIAALAAALLLVGSSAQDYGFPDRTQLRRDVIPYVRCQVCELVAKNALSQAKDLLATSTPTHKVRSRARRGWPFFLAAI